MKKSVDSPGLPKSAIVTEDKLTNKKTAEIAAEVIFSPTAAQAMAKIKFWQKFQPGPTMAAGHITASLAAQVTGIAGFTQWWRQSGFLQWFLNRDEERERLKYLFNKSLTAVEEILDNPEANPSAKANIFKLLAEMQGLTGNKKETKFADADIDKMNVRELEAFLQRKGVKIVQEQVVDIKKEDSEGPFN